MSKIAGERQRFATVRQPFGRLVKIEQVAQEAFAFARMAETFAVLFAVVVIIVVVIVSTFGIVRSRPFDDFVQFSTIQPYASTLGTVINFHALPVADVKLGVAFRTVQEFSPSLLAGDQATSLMLDRAMVFNREMRSSVDGCVLNDRSNPPGTFAPLKMQKDLLRSCSESQKVLIVERQFVVHREAGLS